MDARERLIESTWDLLWERGYVGTSSEAIQARSGEAAFAGPGPAAERVAAYLRRERDVLKGRPVGGLTQDPDVRADPALRAPGEQSFARLTERMAALPEEGRAGGECDAGLDAKATATATALVAVVQGGYVLARPAGTASRSPVPSPGRWPVPSTGRSPC